MCPQAAGCAKLKLTANARSTSGHHTISFQVLNQSPEPVDYLAEGRVLVHREGLPLATTIYLKPTSATLRPGARVNFEVDFLNLVN